MRFLTCAMCSLVLTLFALTPSRAEMVTLRSGNGTIGSTDSLIHLELGPANTTFGAAFTSADFTSARTGPLATIITPNALWPSSLPADSSALWIATDPNGASQGATALYAISFNLAQPAASATLTLNFEVDNQLGDSFNEGVFLNGLAISGNSTGGGFSSQNTLSRTDIAPLLVVGTNTLYLSAENTSGPAGFIFSATISTVPGMLSSAPEPSSAVLGGMGLIGILGYLIRRRGR